MGTNIAETEPASSSRWSVFDQAAALGGEERREVLGPVLQRYMPALRTHLLLRFKISPGEAEQLTQDFVTDKIIAGDLLKRMDRGKGSPRVFLLVALHNYAVRALDNQNKESQRSLPLTDEALAGDREPWQKVMLVWARGVVERARQLMQEGCESQRPDVWLVFSERVLRPAYEGTRRTRRQKLARELKVKRERVSNLLITGKRWFARSLRQAVGEYMSDEREIDREIEDLMRVLSAGR